jgi:uncharacterized protein (DUF433 family)
MAVDMATAASIAYPHITKDPSVSGGKACVENTRIRVLDIVELHREGKSPEQMLRVFAIPLSLAQIHAALAYYYDHREEVDASFAEDDRWEEEHERLKAAHLGSRLPK